MVSDKFELIVICYLSLLKKIYAENLEEAWSE